MGLFNFKKKEIDTIDFNPTKVIATDILEYDEEKRLLRARENYTKFSKPFTIDDITDYEVIYDSKRYNRKNLGSTIVGGAALGVVGVLIAGTHETEKIKGLSIIIHLKDVNRMEVKIPLIIGSVKKNSLVGKQLLKSAERIIRYLDTIMEDK